MIEPFNTQVPNIIDDLGLDPFERALYVHYKRVCGNNPGGYSNETVDTIHKKLRMSAGQVSEARKSLAVRGLIQIQDTRPVVVTIVDIWNLNKTYYQLERERRPDIDGWTVEQLQLWLSDLHPVKLSSHNDSNLSSPDETSSTINEDTVNLVSPSEQDNGEFHTVKLDDNMSTQFHKVKQRIESINPESLKEREESRPPPLDDRQELARQLTETCGYDATVLSNGTRQKLEYALDVLQRKKATPELVKKFGEEYWWGKSPPKPDQLTEEWHRFLQSKKKPKESKTKVSAF